MIIIDAEEKDIAAILEAVAPGKVGFAGGEVAVRIDGRMLRLSDLKLELHTRAAFDNLEAEVDCRVSDGRAYLEVEIK